MKQAPISIAPTQGGYIPMWSNRIIQAPAAPLLLLRAAEIREIIPPASKIHRQRRFRIRIEGPGGAFGWDLAPSQRGGANCSLAISNPDWSEFFSALRVGPVVFYQLCGKERSRISRRFIAAGAWLPEGINIYPRPATTWFVDDVTAIIHLTNPATAWYRDEAIDIEPGLYRAQRIKGEVLRA